MKNSNKVGSSFSEDMFLEEMFGDDPKLDRIVTLQMESLFNTPGVMKEFPNHWGVGDAFNMAINWVVPPPSKSHHQDYYIFNRESL